MWTGLHGRAAHRDAAAADASGAVAVDAVVAKSPSLVWGPQKAAPPVNDSPSALSCVRRELTWGGRKDGLVGVFALAALAVPAVRV